MNQYQTTQTTDIPFNHNLIDGIIYEPLTTKQQLNNLKLSFEARTSDIFLSSYMKSGTLWNMQMVRLIMLKGEDPTDDLNLFEFCPVLEEIPNNDFIKAYPSPRCIHSHIPHNILIQSINKQQPCKYIYTARNPGDVMVSLYYHIISREPYNSSVSWDRFVQLFMAGKVPYGSWYDHVLAWWAQKDRSNILFLKYEDRLNDPHATIRQIADFIAIDLTEKEVQMVAKKSSFSAMKNNRLANGSWMKRTPNSTTQHLRKGIIGDWKNHLTTEQLVSFKKQYNEKTQGTGIDFGIENYY